MNNQIIQNKPNLLNTQMNVSSFLIEDYKNVRLCSREKNKPKQSQTNSKRSGDPLRVSFSESSNRGPIKANLKPDLVQMGHHMLKNPCIFRVDLITYDYSKK